MIHGKPLKGDHKTTPHGIARIDLIQVNKEFYGSSILFNIKCLIDISRSIT